MSIGDFTCFWIDADSCPRSVRNLVQKCSEKNHIHVYFVANRRIPFAPSELTHMIITENTPNAADDYIAGHAGCHDIVITRDIPLAARLVQKNITVINDRGTAYTSANISEKLSLRNFSYDMVMMGIQFDSSASFGKKELNNFANCFDREFQKIKKLYTAISKAAPKHGRPAYG